MAAMVQFVLYVSVMSPLLATSYLLRGVDVPTILVSLVWALVCCVAATAFAISSAAQAILPAMQAFANLGAALGLGLGTFGLVAFVAPGPRPLAPPRAATAGPGSPSSTPGSPGSTTSSPAWRLRGTSSGWL